MLVESVTWESNPLQQINWTRAVFRLHLVILKNDCDCVFALPVNVSRLFRDHEILSSKGTGRTQDRFHLLFRHPFRYLIDIRPCDAFAGTGHGEHKQEYEHEARKNDE